jgi:hypothetical protein
MKSRQKLLQEERNKYTALEKMLSYKIYSARIVPKHRWLLPAQRSIGTQSRLAARGDGSDRKWQ